MSVVRASATFPFWIGVFCVFAAGRVGRTAEKESRIRPDREWSMSVRDSLKIPDDAEEDAREALAGLRWKPGKFAVSSVPLAQPKEEANALLRFPSPRPCGNRICDVATLHWYAALGDDGQPIRAPAVVVVHESGSRQTIGRLFARAFRDKGIHAFLLSLPNYGPRRSPEIPGTADSLLLRMKQGIADARRAYDVVAAIPCVDADHIGVQGISLGGFVVATMAGIDSAYHSVFIMLAGGDLAGIIEHGDDVAARVRERLAAAGVTGEKIHQLAWPVEPLRLAHRLDPARTFLFTAQFDQIVPPENSKRLADAAKLPENHRISLAADHYTGVIYYTLMLNLMAEQLQKP